MSDHVVDFIETCVSVLHDLPVKTIDKMVDDLVECKGRVFVVGLGGSAGNASHMVNDLRKLCRIEAYSPTDNVSEFSAFVNDEGPERFFLEYLMNSKFSKHDILFVLSVGGGNINPPVSISISQAVLHAVSLDAKVLGIVGRQQGTTAQYGDTVVVMPVVDDKLTTPIAEAFQGVIWHMLVSDPRLQKRATKW